MNTAGTKNKKVGGQEKGVVLDRLWLTYFNDTLFAKGVISEAERNVMRVKIKNYTAGGHA